MYLLTRMCSEYTHDNIMLGIFSSQELAEQARERYISETKDNDPHKHQAYMKVCLEIDVVIDPLDEYTDSINGETVYILNEQVEGFGQISREILKVSTSLEDILDFAKSKPIDPNGFPMCCYVYNTLLVDRLYYENEDTYVD